jgi:hypothetical protein
VLVQVDRGGNPWFNPILSANDVKDAYNADQPADEVANYLQPLGNLLETNGYSPEEAFAAAQSVFPDILQYNWTKPALYSNGRGLTEDVFDARLAFLTHGKIGSDGVGPHHDLLTEFPFLGVPNPQPAVAPAHS